MSVDRAIYVAEWEPLVSTKPICAGSRVGFRAGRRCRPNYPKHQQAPHVVTVACGETACRCSSAGVDAARTGRRGAPCPRGRRFHHAGTQTISGAAPDRLETRRRHDHAVPVGPATPVRAPVGATKLDDSVVRAQARDALVGLGWKPGIARTAVDEACAHVGVGAEIAVVIREALQRCPRPKG